jgi:hypothetical protein
MRPFEEATRTFHYDLHVVDQAMDYVESLGNSHLGLLESESIQSLKDRLDVLFA